MSPSSASFLVGLVGTGIGPSLTPALHEREADALGIRYLYRRLDLDRPRLPASAIGEILAAARLAGYDGLNITHPCKQLVLDHLDELSPDAAALGAVNTVVLRDGRAVGHNTDWSGFARVLRPRAARRAADLGRPARRGRRRRGRRARAADAGHRPAHDPRRRPAAAPAGWPPRCRDRFGPGRAIGGAATDVADAADRRERPGARHPHRHGGASRPAAAGRAAAPATCGSPTSSTARWRPRSSAPPGDRAAACSTAAAWPSSRPWTPSSCSPASSPMPSACWPHFGALVTAPADVRVG